MNELLLKTSNKSEPSNMTDNNNNNTQNKYKAYLIEKLLNESSKTNLPPSNQSKLKDTSNELKINGESKEAKEDDVASEAGTYTIDEANDIANAADFNEDVHRQANNNNNNDTHTVELKNTNSTTANELVNARAAINDVFGVVQRPKIDPIDAQTNSQDSPKANVKRQPSKTSRARNQTYSLSKDLHESQTVDKPTNQTTTSSNDHVKDNSFSTSSSSISSCSVDNHSNRMKKTMTYEVISQLAQNGEQASLELDEKRAGQSTMNTSLNLASARTVGTELLLGDTEKLIEQLRKTKRHIDSATIKKRTNNVNGSLSSASSTNSCNNLQQPNELNSVRTSQSWANPTEKDDYQGISSTRATIDFDMNKNDNDEDENEEDPNDPFTNTYSHKIGNGGVAFDFMMIAHTNSPVSTKPMLSNKFTAHKNKSRSESTHGDNSFSSISNFEHDLETSQAPSACSTPKTFNSQLTITKGLIKRRPTADMTSSSIDSRVHTPKSNVTNASTALSLGARIQSKAKEQNQMNTSIDSSHGQNTGFAHHTRRLSDANQQANGLSNQFANRTVYLRQQSSKAKRDSLEQKPNNVSILKNASHSNLNSSPVKMSLSKKKPSARSSSRTSVSRASIETQSTSSLMSTSLNLSHGAQLPGSDSFQRRKNYNPLKAVEQEKLRKLQQHQPNHNSNDKSSNKTLNDHSNEFDSNALALSVQSLTANISNKQTYERIMESTLQRLCIRLIQMSTGVLDKIGENVTTESSLFSATGSTELERMQQLAKLVHSMQLIHDHVQIIDTSLFTSRPEDNYIKELTRIRQEVDNLKQTSVFNNLSSSSREQFN